MAQRGHTDRAGAVGRRVGGQPRGIAGRDHHHGPDGVDLGHGVALGVAARAAAAQAQVDDPGGVGVGRYAGHAQAGGPAHPGNDVGGVAEALAEHAHRQHAHVPAGTRHAHAVVGGRADDARHLRAVPRAVAGVAAVEGAIHGIGMGTRIGVDLRLRQPVARVAGVGVAAVAVVRDRRVADHVVASQQLARQVGVIETHPGVEHGDDHAGAAHGGVPGRHGVDRRSDFAGRRAQVPLADCGSAGAGNRREARVVGHRQAARAAVGLGVLDIGIARQPRGQRACVDALGLHHLHPLAQGRARLQAQAQPRAEHGGALVERARRRSLAASGAKGLRTQQRRRGLELHDHARTAVVAQRHRPRRHALGRRKVADQDKGQGGQVPGQGFHRLSLCRRGAARCCGVSGVGTTSVRP